MPGALLRRRAVWGGNGAGRKEGGREAVTAMPVRNEDSLTQHGIWGPGEVELDSRYISIFRATGRDRRRGIKNNPCFLRKRKERVVISWMEKTVEGRGLGESISYL